MILVLKNILGLIFLSFFIKEKSKDLQIPSPYSNQNYDIEKALNPDLKGNFLILLC
jgi:hypothetical protein